MELSVAAGVVTVAFVAVNVVTESVVKIAGYDTDVPIGPGFANVAPPRVAALIAVFVPIPVPAV
jgi:hypothetical protein